MLLEEAPQMPAPDAEPRREGLEVDRLRLFLGNEAERTIDRRHRPTPGRNSRADLGPATETGPEAG